MTDPIGLAVYLNRLPDAYRLLPAAQQREIELQTREFLVLSFSADLDDKVTRTLETPGFGPLPLLHEFVGMVHELFQLYINGLFHSAVAFAGVVAERLCFDIIEMTSINVEGRTLTNDEKKRFESLRFVDVIKALEEWQLVAHESAMSLDKIRIIRNRYVHASGSSRRNPVEDARDVVKLLLDVADREFGPSATGRYAVVAGKLERRQN